MNSSAATVEEYLASLPDGRRPAITAVLQVVRRHLPKGFEEVMNSGMICWQVPLAVLPDTHNKQPLMYAALANQKHHMALYLCSVYGSSSLRKDLEEGYARAGIRLDMGLGCIRFRKLHHVPLPVIGKIIGAVSMKQYIARVQELQDEQQKKK